MFSGIIQGTGLIEKIDFDEIFFKTSLDLSDCNIGSSISCDGVCLTTKTIEKLKNNYYIFSANIGEETRNRTNLLNDKNIKSNYRPVQSIAKSSKVLINIEKSIKLGQEISGHLVYGHVDCTSKILKISKLDSSWIFEFEKNKNYKNINKFIVEKGSIAVNGISLTIAKVSLNSFSISIIPYTFENTNLKQSQENDSVNIAFDALARYVVRDE